MMIMMMPNQSDRSWRYQYRRIFKQRWNTDYKTQTSNYSDDDDDRETPFAAQ
jgi:hypothetical protein